MTGFLRATFNTGKKSSNNHLFTVRITNSSLDTQTLKLNQVIQKKATVEIQNFITCMLWQ